MSTFEDNASSIFNLTQQDIQNIVLSMFNLFAQNVQNQAQTKIAETINEVIIATVKKSSFRASDVEFFDSQLDSFYDSENVVQIERDLYYKDVYLFVKRVKNAVIMSEAKTIRTNLSICLRESIQIWYIEKLSDLKKKVLRILEDDVDHWCNVLLKKFKKSVVFALNYLITEKYILNDVRANKNISSFVFQIMRHAKIVNIVDLHEQLIWVYNVIVSELTRDIDLSDENITTMIFLKNLETKKNIWHRIYSRKSISSRNEFESSYQTNFSNSSYIAYDQSTYTSRQFRQFFFENVIVTRNYQRFSQNDNFLQKEKVSIKAQQENSDEYNQQTRYSNYENTQNTQFSSFEILSFRNQTILVWRQNVSQNNINENAKQNTQNQFSANIVNTNISSTSRSSLEQFNIEKKEQNFREKRDQFQKFYDNREQSMKVYVEEENENDQKEHTSQH